MTRHRSRLRQVQKKSSRRYLPLWIALGGVLALVTALLVDFGTTSPDENASQEWDGSPALVVDREEVNYGDVKLGTPVTTEFLVTNNGTGELRFSEKPYVEIREGC